MASPEPPLQAIANGPSGTNGTEQINGNGVHDTNFDTSVFRQYLLALLPPVLGATPDELEETLFDSEFDDRVTKFAAEGGGVVYVVKIKHDLGGTRPAHVCVPEWLILPLDDTTPSYSYRLTAQLTYHPSYVTTLALIKRGPTLDPMAPMPTQLHMLNLFGGEETPYESLHAVVSLAVKPWFEAFVGTRGGSKDTDSKIGVLCLTTLDSCLLCDRYPKHQEEIRRTRALPFPSAAKR